MSVLRLVPVIGEDLVVDQDRAVVGREPTCDLVVEHGSVSRKHAVLERRPGGWFVVDQGSANGTFLDSARIAEGALRHGQELRFGAAAFRVDISARRGRRDDPDLGAGCDGDDPRAAGNAADHAADRTAAPEAAGAPGDAASDTATRSRAPTGPAAGRRAASARRRPACGRGRGQHRRAARVGRGAAAERAAARSSGSRPAARAAC